MTHRVGELLDRRDAHEPKPWPGLPHDLEQLAAAATVPADAAHAIAWVLDERFSRTFSDDWIAAGDDDDFDLAHGELYPVLETPWTIFHPHLSRPASMTDPSRDELAHLRRFAAADLPAGKITGVRVHRVTGLLRDVLTSLDTVATAHPNVSLDEIVWPKGRTLWPVKVRDPARQVRIVKDLVTAALDGGSRLIVLPELTATDDTIAAVRALIDARYEEDEEPVIVLAGSRHLDLGRGERRNRAVTLIAGAPTELLHDKLTPFRYDEAIEDLRGDGTLHVYQDGPFRLAAVICKDLLDSDVERVLERLGVNLLLVPAMSVKTPNLPLAAARLLHTAQTLTIVANCPLVDDGSSLPHCSLTARPTADDPAVLSWPSGGHHAAPPDAPVWIGHPLSGDAATGHSRPDQCH